MGIDAGNITLILLMEIFVRVCTSAHVYRVDNSVCPKTNKSSWHCQYLNLEMAPSSIPHPEYNYYYPHPVCRTEEHNCTWNNAKCSITFAYNFIDN